MKHFLSIVAAGFVLFLPAQAQRLFTVESEQESVSAIQLQNDGLLDDVVVLDCASGLLRLGRWSGGTMTWETTPSGVTEAGFPTVGNLALPPSPGDECGGGPRILAAGGSAPSADR